MALLTLADVRAAIETDLTDTPLTILLDAADADIVEAAGAHDMDDAADIAKRKRALLRLVDLDANHKPQFGTFGDGEVRLTQADYMAARSDALMPILCKVLV